MIVIYAIVSSELLLKHLSCRSFFRSGVKSKYQGLLTFRTKYKVFKGGRKFILARLHFGEYLALASLNIRGTLATTLSPWPSLPGWSLPPRFFMACFSRFSSLLKNQLSTFELQCHLLKPFSFYILHVTQSRVSMGLTVSRISVKKLAVKNNNSFLQCVILC